MDFGINKQYYSNRKERKEKKKNVKQATFIKASKEYANRLLVL